MKSTISFLALLMVVSCQAQTFTIKLPTPPKFDIPPGMTIKLPTLPAQVAAPPSSSGTSTDTSSTSTGSTDDAAAGSTDTETTGSTDSESSGSDTVYEVAPGLELLFKNSPMIEFKKDDGAGKSKSSESSKGSKESAPTDSSAAPTDSSAAPTDSSAAPTDAPAN